MKKFVLIVIALLILIFAVSADTSTADVARIHVIANSDSNEDISVKLKVANGISSMLSDNKFSDTESIETGLKANLADITDTANIILKQCGVDYTAKAEVGVKYFDRKTLGNSAFSEGEYLALTVTLGEGKGHNWWSVIFPDISLGASLALGEEESKGKTVIVGGDTVVKIRCLVFDLFKMLLTKE